jgi:subtilisin-like proprotein convertase family protein
MTIIAVTLLLPMLLILPITQAKRATKPSSKPALTQPNTTQASLPSSLKSLMRAQKSLTPVSSKAVSFGVSPAVRDLPVPAQVGKDKNADQNLKMVPNKIIRESIASESARSKVTRDAAIQTSAPAPSIPGTIVNFEGQSIHDTILLGQGFLPPDTVGDVGPNHYVQAVNVTFRVYTKAGVPVTPVRSIGDLFGTIPGPCAGDESGDPIVLYDSYADRWLISQFCTVANPNNHQLIAISQTSDPAGAYYLYDFMMPNNKFNDYPKFGVWPDGYYMTDNQFNQAGTVFLGGGAFAFDREKMLAGDPNASFIYFDLQPLDPTIGGMLPSDADGLNPPAPGTPNVFAYFIATEFGDASDGLRVFDFHADFDTPGNSTFIERPESPIAVAAFDPSTPAGRDHIEQPPPANNATAALDSISDRLMHRLQYRNFGTHQSLIANHTVNVGTGTTQALHQAGVRYYELRNVAGTYGVNEQATFAPDTVNRWMASAAMDHQGNLAVGWSVSDAVSVFPGVRYAGRLASDPPNGLFQGEATMQAGGFVQTNTLSRWGDYSSMNVDPTDDCTFWYTQEYFLADEPTTAEWHTRVGSFKVDTACQAPAQGTLAVNVTDCDSGLPLQGAAITINNNLYGSTSPAGAFGSQLSPGTYTVTISAPFYLPVTINGVIITNGNTTTINECIQGIPNIQAAGATITAESCSPADGTLSPSETVTVDFGLKNNGAAATTNLVATLLATGGVTNPSGPQNYGAIPPDNTTVVVRPFTFTVDPALACGDTVTATFQLQDGTRDLGTVTFTFTIGTPFTSESENFDGVTAPILPAGWTTTTAGSGAPWVTNTTSPDTAPNSAFTANQPATGETSLVSPVIPISTSSAQLTFRNNFTMESTFDGGVLEIKIGAGAFTDIVAAGGSFVSGGYTATLQNFAACNVPPFTPNPLAGRSSWTGNSNGYITTTVNLPASAAGQDIQLRWRAGFDCSVANVGWRVDTVTLTDGFVCCGVAGTPEITAGPATLTTESCPPENDAIDPGERVTVNLELHNIGTGPTNNLVATLVTGGGVSSPSAPQSYGVLGPIGPSSSATRDFTFTASGVCGGSITATWNLTDGMTDLGTVTKTFVLGATANTTHTFANPTPILIPDTPAPAPEVATPYPSTISVAGITETVSKVTVTLKNFNHTFPDDVDVLLVGPGGQRLLLLSDAGGSPNQVNTTWTFDDTAAAGLPDSFPGTADRTDSGTFKPSNFGTGDTFPAPAPAGPYNDPQLLSVFNGVNPNGTWSLYLVDDAGGDFGNINLGWELSITTSAPSCTTPCGMARLVVTSTLTRDNGTTVRATYRVENTGTVQADDVQLTTAQLGATNGTPLPQSLGSIPPGGFSAFSDVFFTNSTPGASSTLRLNGTYTGGTFSSTKRVTIP